MKIAKIYTERQSLSLDRPFDYYIPEFLDVKKGTRVKINFNNSDIVGYVEDIIFDDETRDEYESKIGFKLKEIDEVIDEEPLLNDELSMIASYLSKTTICNKIVAYQAILPPSLKPNSSKRINKKTRMYLRVIGDNVEGLTAKQLEVYNNIKNNHLLNSEVKNVSIVSKLIELGLVEKYYETVYRTPTIDSDIKYTGDFVFTSDQAKVFSEIYNSNDQTYLLEGVTGSGKTEIYLRLAKDALKKGKNVLILVPEISLTPLMIKRFKERFDYPLAIFHSGLSNGEKYDEYRRIKSGVVRIVIGARSAIFSPLENIGLIVVDEEHSDSYKQSEAPSYHMIDIALLRAKYHNCKVILGSATPSIESKTKAIKGIYHQLYLNKRITNVSLPKVEIIDLNNELRGSNYTLISKTLRDRINNALNIGHQAILLLNRRGYAYNLKCAKCGNTFNCPTCNIPMHYHKSDNSLKCHYCGKSITRPTLCPACGSKYIRNLGSGTQKLEEEISKIFPNAKVLRLDLDTTTKKDYIGKALKEFEEHKYDIMLGTQIIAKGLDFVDVDVVGVVNADASLFSGDFRSNEVAFQLFTQVIGRCGRGDRIGHAIIQTYSPNNKVILYSAKQDYNSFYTNEMKFRKMMNYPPYKLIASITIVESTKDKAYKNAVSVVEYINSINKDESLEILGPSEPFMSNEYGKYKYRIILKYINKDLMLELLNEVKVEALTNRINIRFDTNPYQNI